MIDEVYEKKKKSQPTLERIAIGINDDAYHDDVWKDFIKQMLDPNSTRAIFKLEKLNSFEELKPRNSDEPTNTVYIVQVNINNQKGSACAKSLGVVKSEDDLQHTV